MVEDTIKDKNKESLQCYILVSAADTYSFITSQDGEDILEGQRTGRIARVDEGSENPAQAKQECQRYNTTKLTESFLNYR